MTGDISVSFGENAKISGRLASMAHGASEKPDDIQIVWRGRG